MSMSTIQTMGTEKLNRWVSAQRWYAGKGSEPSLSVVGSWNLPSRDEVTLCTYFLLDASSSPSILYQVPITQRLEPIPGGEAALIAIVKDEVGQSSFLYDGPHDPVFAEQLLRLIVEGGDVRGQGVRAVGVPLTQVPLDAIESHVLRAEQSNTSIVYNLGAHRQPLVAGSPIAAGSSTAAGSPAAGSPAAHVVCKIFRSLQAGDNPDVVLQSVLSTAGSLRVPASIGSIAGEWDELAQVGGTAKGQLVFAQEFLQQSEDAWALALRCAESGEDFAEFAHEFGVATAEVHATLAASLPTRFANDAEIADMVGRWRRRFETAVAEVPALAQFSEAIESLYSAAGTVVWPPLQRIHGDLHLGQVLSTPGGRCVIIDFEGEPLRSMSERSEPDLALRDVAGMLRSFEYVAGTHPAVTGIGEWAAACRTAYLDGYQEFSSDDPRAHRTLLDALEADKALYEAIYEARNRPAWLPIPTAAIRRIADRALERDLTGR
jgi:maltokinase